MDNAGLNLLCSNPLTVVSNLRFPPQYLPQEATPRLPLNAYIIVQQIHRQYQYFLNGNPILIIRSLSKPQSSQALSLEH